MKGSYKFLLIDDNVSDATLVKRHLEGYWKNLTLKVIDQRSNIRKLLTNEWDLVICDYSMPQLTGIDVLNMIKSLQLDIPLVMISGTMGEVIAVDVMKAGAADYILKENIERLNPIIERVICNKRRQEELESTQEALKESLFISEAIITDSPLGISVRDTSMRLILHNKSWQKIWGFTEEQVELQKNEIKEDLEDFYDFAKGYHKHIRKLYSEGKEFVIPEIKLEKKNKNRADWVSQHYYALKDNAGKVKLIVSVTEDISLKKENELLHELYLRILKILNQSESWRTTLQEVLNQMKATGQYDSIALRVKAGEDYPFFVHAGFDDKFIAKESCLLSRNTNHSSCLELDCLCGRVIKQDYARGTRCFNSNGSFLCNDLDNLLATASDDLLKLINRGTCLELGYKSIALIPLKTEEEIKGLLQIDNYQPNAFSESELSFLEEIGSTIAIALQRKESQEKLTEIKDNLEIKVNRAVKDLREKDHLIIKQTQQAARGEMISQLAHHWRQPLNAIGVIVQSLGDVLEYEELTQEQLNKKIDNVMKVLKSLSKSIDDFREIYDGNPEQTEFEVTKYLGDIERLMKRRFKNNHISFEVEIKSDGILKGVPSEYSQAIINILENAGEVLISRKIKNPWTKMKCWNQDGKVYVSIRDNAGGIKDELKDNIFDLYATGKESLNNTGVGLYMSKQIIEYQMGGHIEVINHKEGTEFLICNNLKK